MSKENLLRVLKVVGISVILTVFLLFLFNYIAYKSENPDKYIGIFAYAIIVIVSVVIGIISSFTDREKPVLNALICSVCYAVLYMVICFIFGGSIISVLIRISIIIGCSVLISLFVKPKNNGELKRMKKYKKQMKSLT